MRAVDLYLLQCALGEHAERVAVAQTVHRRLARMLEFSKTQKQSMPQQSISLYDPTNSTLR